MPLPCEEEALNLISLGRAFVVDHTKEPCAPYIAQTLLNLTPVPRLGTKGPLGVTEQMVMIINPVWIMEDPWLSQKHIMAACLVHETEHILRGIDRLRALPNQEIANIAGDLAINCCQRREGWILPPWVHYPELYGFEEFLTLEQYYQLLSDMCQQSHGGSLQKMMNALTNNGEGDGHGEGDGDQDGDEGQGSAGGAGDPGGDQDGDQGAGGKGKGWKPNIGSGACGSVGGNSLDPQAEAEVNREHGRSGVEVEAIRRGTLDDIEEHIEQHGRGSVPGRFSELIKMKLKPPEINWKATLRKVIRRTLGMLRFGQRDYSMLRPSMSSPFLGVVLPSLIDQEIEVAVARDTSGSMGNPQLQSANRETMHAAKKAGVQQFWLIDADVIVHSCKRVKIRDVPKIPLKGRGGTDFRMVFEVVRKLRPRPNVLIYVTDGDGVAPRKPPPGITVIWCIVRTDWARRPATWGTVVVCDKNQELMEPVMED